MEDIVFEEGEISDGELVFEEGEPTGAPGIPTLGLVTAIEVTPTSARLRVPVTY